MSWDRAVVADALVSVLGAAAGVTVHPRPPEIVNPMCLVVDRPTQVTYAVAGLGVDEAVMGVTVVGGAETEDQVEALKDVCRAAVDADPTLGGAVKVAYATEERNWRNVTGAGGVQLLLVELILTIDM